MGLGQTQNIFVNCLLTNFDLAILCKKSKRFFVDFATRMHARPKGPSSQKRTQTADLGI